MNWFYLILAGMLEIGWPLGLKLAQQEGYRWQGIAVALACIVGSGFFLFLAQKNIPMGTAYAVWTGIGAAGAFLVGVGCRQLRPLARRILNYFRRNRHETFQPLKNRKGRLKPRRPSYIPNITKSS